MAGAGFKDFQAGDILTAADVDNYLMQQTVMVFDDSSARDTALTGVVAEGMFSYLKSDDTLYQYNGTAWEVAGSPEWLTNYPTNTPELAAESSGQVLMTTGSLATPVWQAMPTVNYIINGAFDVWQRGTSFAVSSSTWSADRWKLNVGSAATTISRQTATPSATNSQYGIRVQRDSGNASTNLKYLAQSIANDEAVQMVGKSVTLSFYAKKGANYSPSSSLLGAFIYSGTGTNQNFIDVAITGQTTVASASVTLGTDLQRYSITGTVPTNATQLFVVFIMSPTGTAGANDWYQVEGVQLEAGSIATPFKRHAPSLQGELAACQRYYYRINVQGTTAPMALGFNTSTTVSRVFVQFPVTMRTSPTALEQTGTATDYQINSGSTAVTCSAVPTHLGSSINAAYMSFTAASGLTTGQGSLIRSLVTEAYLGWSAEL